jgi:hypothetical protein
MSQNAQSSISRFLFDRLKRSTENSLTLSERFIFSFLHDKSNFETIFKILYSAFQCNLIKNPEEFEYWIPEPIENYPESLDFITITKTEYENIQNDHYFRQSQTQNIEKEQKELKQLNDQSFHEFNNLQIQNSQLQTQIQVLHEENEYFRQLGEQYYNQFNNVQNDNSF